MNPSHVHCHNHPHQAALEKAIEQMLLFTPVDSIYFSPHLEESTTAGVFLTIISEDSPFDWDELATYFQQLYAGFPQFAFRLFGNTWIKEELQNGNPFFVMHCQQQHLIYSSGNTKELHYISKLKTKRFLKSSERRFEVDNQSAFLVGLDFKHYMAGNNTVMAAYNAHQNIKWLFVTASSFLIGEWFNSNDLVEQQNYLNAFTPLAGKIFDPATPSDVELLNLLNQARRTIAHHTAPPQITKEQLKIVEEKKEILRKEVHRLFYATQTRCEEQLAQRFINTGEPEQQHRLEEVIHFIVQTTEPLGIYSLGKRIHRESLRQTILNTSTQRIATAHHYLLIIVNRIEAGTAAQLANRIKNQFGGQHTATILLHKKTALNQKPGDQQHFFYNALHHGKVLYQHPTTPPYLTCTNTPIRDLSTAQRFWEQRQATVAKLLETLPAGPERGNKVYLFTLHQSIMHTCLGLIRLVLGYRPNHFSLPYLLELCDFCSPHHHTAFPRHNEKDKTLLKLLSSHLDQWHANDFTEIAQQDYETLQTRCLTFIEQCKTTAEKR